MHANRLALPLFALLATLALMSCGGSSSNPAMKYTPAELSWCDTTGDCGSFTDSRDSQSYAWTKIGTQVWMAQNLNYAPATGNSWCYSNDTTNCTTYGRLYDWNTADSVCPSGWHLPDTAAWSTLETYVSGSSVAGYKLKSKDSTEWNSNPGIGGYGFAAIAGGDYNDTVFNDVGYGGNWWTATSNGSASALVLNMSWAYVGATFAIDEQAFGYSVRCVKDSL